MAGRRKYFHVADSVADEPWSNDELAALIRLMGKMNTRWARNNLTPEQASTIRLGPTEIMAVSGKRRPDVALTLLERLADVASMSVRRDGYVVEINWPNFAEFQGYEGRARPQRGHSVSVSASVSVSELEEKTRAPSATPAARARVRRSAGQVDPRVEAAWPAIRDAFAEHGTQLGESIAIDRSKLIAKRIDAGATTDDLVAAVHGYVRANGLERRPDGFDPGRYFRPQTIFKEDGFSDRVDAGRGPRPVARGASKAERLWGHLA